MSAGLTDIGGLVWSARLELGELEADTVKAQALVDQLFERNANRAINVRLGSGEAEGGRETGGTGRSNPFGNESLNVAAIDTAIERVERLQSLIAETNRQLATTAGVAPIPPSTHPFSEGDGGVYDPEDERYNFRMNFGGGAGGGRQSARALPNLTYRDLVDRDRLGDNLGPQGESGGGVSFIERSITRAAVFAGIYAVGRASFAAINDPVQGERATRFGGANERLTQAQGTLANSTIGSLFDALQLTGPNGILGTSVTDSVLDAKESLSIENAGVARIVSVADRQRTIDASFARGRIEGNFLSPSQQSLQAASEKNAETQREVRDKIQELTLASKSSGLSDSERQIAASDLQGYLNQSPAILEASRRQMVATQGAIGYKYFQALDVFSRAQDVSRLKASGDIAGANRLEFINQQRNVYDATDLALRPGLMQPQKDDLAAFDAKVFRANERQQAGIQGAMESNRLIGSDQPIAAEFSRILSAGSIRFGTAQAGGANDNTLSQLSALTLSELVSKALVVSREVGDRQEDLRTNIDVTRLSLERRPLDAEIRGLEGERTRSLRGIPTTGALGWLFSGITSGINREIDAKESLSRQENADFGSRASLSLAGQLEQSELQGRGEFQGAEVAGIADAGIEQALALRQRGQGTLANQSIDVAESRLRAFRRNYARHTQAISTDDPRSVNLTVPDSGYESIQSIDTELTKKGKELESARGAAGGSGNQDISNIAGLVNQIFGLLSGSN